MCPIMARIDTVTLDSVNIRFYFCWSFQNLSTTNQQYRFINLGNNDVCVSYDCYWILKEFCFAKGCDCPHLVSTSNESVLYLAQKILGCLRLYFRCYYFGIQIKYNSLLLSWSQNLNKSKWLMVINMSSSNIMCIMSKKKSIFKLNTDV